MHCRTCDGGSGDGAYLCAGCGEGHARAGHERVWVCEVCELAPAAVTCKADAAALCAACDDDIHHANPLARRHERVPVQPIGSSSPEGQEQEQGQGHPHRLLPRLVASSSSATTAAACAFQHKHQEGAPAILVALIRNLLRYCQANCVWDSLSGVTCLSIDETH